jgi:hypothetical protein
MNERSFVNQGRASAHSGALRRQPRLVSLLVLEAIQ